MNDISISTLRKLFRENKYHNELMDATLDLLESSDVHLSSHPSVTSFHMEVNIENFSVNTQRFQIGQENTTDDKMFAVSCWCFFAILFQTHKHMINKKEFSNNIKEILSCFYYTIFSKSNYLPDYDLSTALSRKNMYQIDLTIVSLPPTERLDRDTDSGPFNRYSSPISLIDVDASLPSPRSDSSDGSGISLLDIEIPDTTSPVLKMPTSADQISETYNDSLSNDVSQKELILIVSGDPSFNNYNCLKETLLDVIDAHQGSVLILHTGRKGTEFMAKRFADEYKYNSKEYKETENTGLNPEWMSNWKLINSIEEYQKDDTFLVVFQTQKELDSTSENMVLRAVRNGIRYKIAPYWRTQQS